MKTHAATDVEALARGQLLPSAAFQSLFADPEAVAELARLLQVADLLGPMHEEHLSARTAAEADVSFEELAHFGEGRALDPQRRQALHDFLDRHGLLHPPSADPDTSPPPGIADAPTKDDTIRGGDTDTKCDPDPA
jgi:hypothetical protein